MQITERRSKSILTPSKLPGVDFVINPYSGCAFGCIYCYADFTRRFTGHTNDVWGEYVDIKTNADELLRSEIQKVLKIKKIKQNNYKTGSLPVVFLGSVTDPYQGVEAKYRLTRKCHQILLEYSDQIEVSLLTKSPLVARDIDLFKRFKHIDIGVTVTSIDTAISRTFEKNAPDNPSRLETLSILNDAGIKTYAFIGPILPVVSNDDLYDLLSAIKKTGTKRVWAEYLNLSGGKKQRLFDELDLKKVAYDKQLFEKSQTDSHKSNLYEYFVTAIKELDLVLIGGDIVDHEKLMTLNN